jgi:hypothetical protein
MVALGLSAAATARAQTLATPPARPMNGLFGRAAGGDQGLDVSISTVGAFSDNVLESNPGGSISGPAQSGDSGLVAASASYWKKTEKSQFGVSEASTVSYYPTLSDLVGVQHQVNGTAGFSLGKAMLNVGQSFAVLPFFQFVSVPQIFAPDLAEPPVGTLDSTTIRRDQRLYSSLASLSIPVGRRSNLTFTGNYSDSNFVEDGTGMRSDSVGGRFTRGLTKDLGLVLGYTYQTAEYKLASSPDQTTRVHNLDVGVDYNHPLGPTHRTRFGFTTGTTAIQPVGAATQYRLIGTARLDREIGRTWHTAVAYDRNVSFIDGFSEPFFFDSIGLDAGGTLSRRLNVSLVASYSVGTLGTASSNVANDTTNYTGSASAHLALSRFTAISLQWFLHRYQFAQGTTLPAGMAPNANGQGVRFGLDLWLPLIR